VLGSHKTWRGLVFGLLLATLTLWLQQLGVEHVHWIKMMTSQVDYTTLPTLILGPAVRAGGIGR